MTDRRLRVLVSAYACNPYKGSEEGVGWGWVIAIAKHHDLWVIVAEYHRDDIERAVAANPDELGGIQFHYVPHKPWHYRPTKVWTRIEGSILKPIMNRAYRLWQSDAYRLGRELHGRVGFDVAHLITYVGFRFPGHLWKLDIPFVWGPIGGLENTPWRFLPMLGVKGCVYYAGRNIINSLHRRFLTGPKGAFAKADGAIMAATAGIQREIRRWYGVDSEVLCEIGPPDGAAAEPSTREAGEPLRIVWSGQHLPGKALGLALKAVAGLSTRIDWRLDILGEGPCTGKWRVLARKLGIHDRCHWHGWIPRSEAVSLMHKSHVLLLTSLKDLTSTVLLEALSQGTPVVCPDHCGFSNVVTAACGIKIPIQRPRQLVAGFTQALVDLDGDESRRRSLAAGALARIGDFTWAAKSRKIDAIYRKAVGSQASGGLNAAESA